jgi:hypothetical protein
MVERWKVYRSGLNERCAEGYPEVRFRSRSLLFMTTSRAKNQIFHMPTTAVYEAQKLSLVTIENHQSTILLNVGGGIGGLVRGSE